MILILVPRRKGIAMAGYVESVRGSGKRRDGPAIAGPMVGHVTADKAHLWAWAGKNPEIQVDYWPNGGPVKTRFMTSDVQDDNYTAGKVRLIGLRANTEYHYRCHLEGEIIEGRFKTAPGNEPLSHYSFKVAASSCMRRRDDPIQWAVMGIFNEEFGDRASSERVDLQLIIGDSVYYDDKVTSDDPDGGLFKNYDGEKLRRWLWTYHLLQRNVEATDVLSNKTVKTFAQTLRNVPTYAIWDDHDYAYNNSDGGVTQKNVSLSVFNDVWSNPVAGETSRGIYYHFKWGPDIEFFMLDCRWNKISKNKLTVFGSGQLRWLRERLNASTALFKVVVSGSTRGSSREPHENWGSYASDLREIRNIINGRDAGGNREGKKISGVILLSGDVHRCDVRLSHGDLAPYRITEVISSGVGTVLNAGQFVTLTFEKVSSESEPRVKIERIRPRMVSDVPDATPQRVQDSKTIELRELQHLLSVRAVAQRKGLRTPFLVGRDLIGLSTVKSLDDALLQIIYKPESA